MKNISICKFIPEAAADVLIMHNFVYERSVDAMKIPSVLTCHKAILIVHGSGEFHFDDKSVDGSVGDMVFCFQGEDFYCEPEPDLEYIYVSFSGARAESLMRRFGINRQNRRFEGFEGIIPLWRDSISRASDNSIDLASEGALLYALSRFSTDEREKGDVINRAVSFIEENFTDAELCLSAVAKDLGYNSKYLSHIFKEKMGMSFSEYLRTLRIKHAVMLFDHGLDSVKNVAFLSGFSDPLYFSSVFKSTVGIAPKEYKDKQ